MLIPMECEGDKEWIQEFVQYLKWRIINLLISYLGILFRWKHDSQSLIKVRRDLPCGKREPSLRSEDLFSLRWSSITYSCIIPVSSKCPRRWCNTSSKYIEDSFGLRKRKRWSLIQWNLIKKLKNQGGLGVRDIYMKNGFTRIDKILLSRNWGWSIYFL